MSMRPAGLLPRLCAVSMLCTQRRRSAACRRPAASAADTTVGEPGRVEQFRQLGARQTGHVGCHVDHRPAFLVGLLRSEEHTSELQSLMRISYAVFCLKKKKQK